MKQPINELSLKSKVAIVTGAGTGIGEAVAHKFAQLGAKVICAGLPGDPIEDVVKSIGRFGGIAIGFEGDLSMPQNAQACVQFAQKNYARLDILVNNAGVTLADSGTDQVSDDTFKRTIQNNIFSVFYMTRAALPLLQKSRGALLSTGSVAGTKGEPGDTVYSGTKAFIHGFMQSLAVEQAPHGVRVNCVLPGAIDTAMTRAAHSAMTKEEVQQTVEEIPMKRKGTPEEVANVFAFLASDMATYVNGALWQVDGAYTLAWGDVEDVPADLRRKPKGTLEGRLQHSTDGGYKKNNPPPEETKLH